MDRNVVLSQRSKVEQFRLKHRIGLLTLLFTDIVGSTKLKQGLGDRRAVELMQFHHQKVRDTLALFPEGEEINTAGDSFFIVFAKPSDAAKFCLLLQSQLRQLARETGHPVYDRIGIHVGEVFR
jgi:class 3 adenylate cyclase